ncbi:MAG: hypothetical protein K1X89_07240, partial [Myxococcaceae bacterium]|nr:hypothetical protein [Myxococcaceae bacterium]
HVGPAPFVLAGAAVVATAAGAILGARAKAVASEASAEPLDLRSDRLASSARGLAIGANVGYGLGAALAAAAVVTFVVQLP